LEKQLEPHAPTEAEVRCGCAGLESERVNRVRNDTAVGTIEHHSDQPSSQARRPSELRSQPAKHPVSQAHREILGAGCRELERREVVGCVTLQLRIP
jgi:hypothetical protein